MKKILTVILSVCMLTAMSITTFAANIETVPANETGDVKVNVADKDGNTDVGTVYYVVVEWEDLSFSYKFDAEDEKLTWNPENHIYTVDGVAATGSWSNGTTIKDAIKITNHSNAAVSVAAAFDESGSKTATTSNVTATLSGDVTGLATAEGTTVADAPNGSFNVSVDENDVPNAMGEITVGIVTVTISK